MPPIRREIRFLLNDAPVTEARVGPRDTLLDWLRLERRLCGTKEGCAEGDCGACTVLEGRLEDGALRYVPVNACIRPLAAVDGAHVVTIEGLTPPSGLHPVQAAMVERHGSQCGFCTPGIVMALAAFRMTGVAPTDDAVDRALQGNLCRCTGYAPIVRAARDACAAPGEPLVERAAETARALAALADGARVDIGEDDDRVVIPPDAEDLAAVLAETPGVTLVAGATDVGLWVTKRSRPVGATALIGRIPELRRIEDRPEGLTLGAAVTYAEAEAALLGRFPQIAELWSRIGGPQVRAAGTIGGNIANGSPIGECPPAFIALGATLTLRLGAARRTAPLEAFFLDYGRQDRAAGEVVESVFLPAPGAHDRLAVYKVSKRRDEDITAVCGAFLLRLEGGRVAQARLAYGGMAGTPRRAPAAEAALTGAVWGLEAAERAASALAHDFTPLSDLRASAAYRARVAANLLIRFALEDAGEPVRLGVA